MRGEPLAILWHTPAVKSDQSSFQFLWLSLLGIIKPLISLVAGYLLVKAGGPAGRE